MKKKIDLITKISTTVIAISTVFLFFVTNLNAEALETSVVEDKQYLSYGFEEDEELDENVKIADKNKNKANGTVDLLSAYKVIKSTEAGSALTESYKLGDVNLDGKTDIKDATQIQRIIANFVESTDEINALADVNADNLVNIFDATQIQKYCVGLIDDLGSSEPTTEPTTESTKPSENTENLPPKAPVQNGEWGASVKN